MAFEKIINTDSLNSGKDKINKMMNEIDAGGITAERISGAKIKKRYLDSLIDSSFYGANGEIGTSDSWKRTEMISVYPGDIIEVTNAYQTWVTFFDSSKTYVSSQIRQTVGSATAIVPAGVSYAGFNITKANEGGYTLKINGTIGYYDIPWLYIQPASTPVTPTPIVSTSFWSGKKGVMFGDSIVSGEADDSTEKGGYPRRIQETLGFASVENRGISGRPMADGTANGVGTNTTIKSVADYKPYDLVIIAAGTNDFKLNVPLGSLGTIEDSTFDVNTFYGAYRDAIEYILKSDPTVRICLWTPLYRDNGSYTTTTTNTAGHKLIDYVNAIKNIGELYSIPVVDMYRNSGLNKLNLLTYTTDGLHLNGLGYDIVSLYASKQIETI